jgi:hypothetical protein
MILTGVLGNNTDQALSAFRSRVQKYKKTVTLRSITEKNGFSSVRIQ